MTTIRCRLLSPTDPTSVRYLDEAVVSWDSAGRLTYAGPPDGRAVDEDLGRALVVPGFVDSHVHYPQTRIVGSASGPLLDWLAKSVFPEEARFREDGHARKVAGLFADALARNGTTLSFVYGPVFATAVHALFEVLDERGLRAIAGPVLMDDQSPEALTVPADRALADLSALADRWEGHDEGRLRVAAIPRFALSCSAEIMRRAGELAQGRKLWTSTHVSENRIECEVATSRFKARDYLSIYEDCGLVGPRSVYAHCIHFSESEWDRFAASGAVVAHCPDSNDFLGSGGMPIASVVDRQIPLSIGSDIGAGRSFSIPKNLSSVYDNALRQGKMTDPRTLFWWGTRGGALSLGADQVGQIEPGLEADLVCYEAPEWVEGEEALLGWLLLNRDLPLARKTWVRGRAVWGA